MNLEETRGTGFWTPSDACILTIDLDELKPLWWFSSDKCECQGRGLFCSALSWWGLTSSSVHSLGATILKKKKNKLLKNNQRRAMRMVKALERRTWRVSEVTWSVKPGDWGDTSSWLLHGGNQGNRHWSLLSETVTAPEGCHEAESEKI